MFTQNYSLLKQFLQNIANLGLANQKENIMASLIMKKIERIIYMKNE